jgi:hypothetical protein
MMNAFFICGSIYLKKVKCGLFHTWIVKIQLNSVFCLSVCVVYYDLLHILMSSVRHKCM